MERMEFLKRQVERLEQELDELKRSLPAHSLRPHQIQALEDLEERLAEARKELAQREGNG